MGRQFNRIILVSMLLFIVFIPPLSGHPLDNWHLRSSSTVNDLNDVAFGNGVGVAVGKAGTIVISYDLLDWTSQVSGTTLDLIGVAFGNGMFVAVGAGGTILTSIDGITWESRDSTTSLPLSGVAYGNGVFVAVGGCLNTSNQCFTGPGVLLTSSDGTIWTERTPVMGMPFPDVIFGDGIFMIAGNSFFYGDVFSCSGVLYKSPDGTVWTPSDSGVNCPTSISYGNGEYFVSGGKFQFPAFIPQHAASVDGITWQASTVGVGNNTIFGDGYFVTPLQSGNVSTSTDGTIWSTRITGSTVPLKSSLHVNRTFVVVGDSGTILQSDPLGFLDVPSGYFAESQINAIHDYGITSGCGNGNYCPDQPITRAQMAVFLLTSLGSLGRPLPDACSGVFNDVNASTVGDVFCRFIERFAQLGITGGCGGGSFCPNDPVTRGQMAVFIEAALGNPGNACTGRFMDVPGGHPFCGFVERLADDGITGGCSQNPPMFCPNDPVTRAQMAVFLVAAPAPLDP